MRISDSDLTLHIEHPQSPLVRMLAEDLRELRAEHARALDLLQRIGCVCAFGIGHPSFSDHNTLCKEARAILAAAKHIDGTIEG